MYTATIPHSPPPPHAPLHLLAHTHARAHTHVRKQELAEDVETLMALKTRVLAALSDARDSLQTAARHLSSKAARGQLQRAAMKLWFFL